MKLSFGAAAYLVPFAVVAAGGRVVAATYASHLSSVMVTVMAPFTTAPAGPAALALQDDVPRAALAVAEESTPESIGDAPNPGKKRAKQGAKSTASDPNHLPSIHVSARRVLELANAGRRPTGRSVTAEGRRPAGVQVFGASALGIGVRDGDVITRVNGVAVTSANQIVALVIAARGARQSAISATVYRGQRSYTLTVEQPYLPSAKESPRAEVDSRQVEDAGS